MFCLFWSMSVVALLQSPLSLPLKYPFLTFESSVDD